jgi:endonuclease/exonuclease/phosphatase family metal-dependent hydrolase
MWPVTSDTASPIAPPARKARGELRIATFNTWAIPGISQDLQARTARMGDALAAFEPDVICLQEVFSDSALARIADGLGPAYTATSGHPGGLVIFSRLPMRSERFTPFPDVRGLSLIERFAKKGILDVVVETEAGALRVVNTHLALAFGPDNPRSRQLLFLLNRLAENPDMPVVVAADLNTPPVRDGRLTDDYLHILALGYESGDPPRPLPDGTFLAGTPTRIGWPRPAEVERVFYPDHILLKRGPGLRLDFTSFGVALADVDTALSDHNLLVADFAIERP